MDRGREEQKRVVEEAASPGLASGPQRWPGHAHVI